MFNDTVELSFYIDCFNILSEVKTLCKEHLANLMIFDIWCDILSEVEWIDQTCASGKICQRNVHKVNHVCMVSRYNDSSTLVTA